MTFAECLKKKIFFFVLTVSHEFIRYRIRLNPLVNKIHRNQHIISWLSDGGTLSKGGVVAAVLQESFCPTPFSLSLSRDRERAQRQRYGACTKLKKEYCTVINIKVWRYVSSKEVGTLDLVVRKFSRSAQREPQHIYHHERVRRKSVQCHADLVCARERERES